MRFLEKLSIMLVAGLLYIGGQYFRGVWFMNFPINVCGHASDSNGAFCNSPFLDTLGWPLIEVGTILFFVSLIVLMSNNSGFMRWKKFSYFAIPAAIVLFFIACVAFPKGALFFIDRTKIIDFIGYWFYLPLTALIVLVSWLPGRKSQ